MAKNTATHSGHCQCCGRLQKLPGGVLSQHGYTVRHGYFSGVCRGHGFKPFEESCDQVKRYIAEAEAHLAGVLSAAEAVRALVGDTCKLSIYDRTLNNGRGGYAWREVKVAGTRKDLGDGRFYIAYTYTESNGKVHDDLRGGHRGVAPYEPEGQGKSFEQLIEATAAHYNEQFAARTLDKEAAQLRSYIKWQQERVDTWKPMPLLPVAHKDKEGFKVE